MFDTVLNTLLPPKEEIRSLTIKFGEALTHLN